MSYNYKRPRPNYHHDSGDDYYPKKRRYVDSAESTEKRLETIICKLGEKVGTSVETSLESVVGVILQDFANYKNQVIDILIFCAYSIPDKITIYSTLAGLLNQKNSEFGSELLDASMVELKRLISTNQFDYAQYLIRLFADLCNTYLVKPLSFLSLLNSLVTVTKQEETPQKRKDWYLYAALSSLPWAGAILQRDCPEELEALLFKIDSYMKKRDKTHHEYLRVWSVDEPHAQEEYLECLYSQILKFKNDNWTESVILKPYQAFDIVLKQSFPHNISEFIVPPHVEGKSTYPMPSVIFRMFDYTDIAEDLPLPGNHAIERWLIEENIKNIINTYKNDRKDCACRMLNCYDFNKIPVNYILAEVVFGDLFCLPSSSAPVVFHTAIFIELCRLQPSKMPQILALATDMLFERLSSMNITCFDRFVNWFSAHLSNFQFTWSWDDWEPCLKLNPSNPQPKFVKESLEKAIKLSYYQKITGTVPSSFSSLLPAKPVCNFKYKDELESVTGDLRYTAAQKMDLVVRRRPSHEDIFLSLEEIIPSTEREDSPVFERIELFLQCILNLAKKSFSHSFSALARYHKVIKELAQTPDKKMYVLQVLGDFWKNNTSMVSVLVDKMLRLQIVTCQVVINWIFSDSMASEFTRIYVWEIVHSTIVRMNKNVQRKMKEHNEIQEKIKVEDQDIKQVGFVYILNLID